MQFIVTFQATSYNYTNIRKTLIFEIDTLDELEDSGMINIFHDYGDSMGGIDICAWHTCKAKT